MNQKIKIIIYILLCCYANVGYTQLKQITAAEYFWDTDPGAGNGTALTAVSGSFTKSIETALLNTSSLPVTGNHVFNVRFKDAYNNWSPKFKTVIILLPNINTTRDIKVTAAEYFWDSDPGAGNATPMVAFDNSFDESIEEVLKNSASIPITNVPHVFNIRIKDAANNWGSAFKTVIDILPNVLTVRNIKVIAAEYFWDSDPGAGNATPMVAFDNTFDESIEEVLKNNAGIPVTNVPHVFNIRVKDAANNWGSTFKTVIDILPSVLTVRNIKVIAAEYFWDSDPGAGNATPMVAFDSQFDESIEEVLKNSTSIPVNAGPHVLNIRVKDAANNWSTTFKTVIDILSNISTVRNIKVTAGEYFWDTDPGNGNATAMLAFDGNFNSAFEQIIGGAIPSPVASGVHVLYTRARDAENNWGPKFGIVVNMDTSINAINVQINGTTSLCQNDLSNVNYTTPLVGTNTYNWVIAGGTIASGQATNQITVNWNASGPYQLKLIECSTLPAICDSDIITLNVLPVPTSNANAAICQGQSIFLGGAQQTQPGVYIDTYSAANLCDSIVSTTLTVYAVYNITNNVTICQGDSFYVAGQFQQTAGTYVDYLTTFHNCDSNVTTNLTVTPAFNYITTTSICNGDSILFNGNYYLQAGSYSFTYQTPSGCDSIVTLQLGVNPNYTNVTNASICHGDSALFNGSYYSFAGSYVFNYQSVNGCDSIITFQLSVNPDYSNVTNASICNGDSAYFNGNYYSLAGSYFFNYQTTNGCDSSITLQLSVNPTFVNTSNVNINIGDSLFAGGAWQTTTGTYYDSLLTANGCDSIIITNLTVINGINSITVSNLISVYPNPFNDEIILDLKNIKATLVDIELLDVTGKSISEWKNIVTKKQVKLNPKSIAAGTYILAVKTRENIYRAVLLKQ